MIRMGLPPPFGPVTSIPLELCTGGKGKVKRRRDELLASDESEMESDNEDMKPKTKRAKLAAPPIQSNVPFPISLYGRPCVSNSTLLSFESDNTAPRQQHIHRQNMPLSNSTARKAPVARVPLFRPYQFSNRPFVYPTPSEAGPPGVYAAPPPRNFTNPSFFKPPPFLSVRPPSAIEPAPPGTSPCLPTPGTTRTRSETARLTTPSILNPLIYAPMPPGVGYRPNFPRFRPPPTHAPAPIVIFHTPSSRPPDLPNMNRPQLVGRAVPSQTANGTSIETTAASKSVQKAVDTMKNGESEANAPIERARMSIEGNSLRYLSSSLTNLIPSVQSRDSQATIFLTIFPWRTQSRLVYQEFTFQKDPPRGPGEPLQAIFWLASHGHQSNEGGSDERAGFRALSVC